MRVKLESALYVSEPMALFSVCMFVFAQCENALLVHFASD